MNNSLRYSINPVIHVFNTFVFGLLVINFEWLMTQWTLVLFLIISILINAASFAFISRGAKWRYYFLSIVIFVLLVVFSAIIRNMFGNQEIEVEGNIADGLILIVILFLSLLSIMVGNVMGILLIKYKKSRLPK